MKAKATVSLDRALWAEVKKLATLAGKPACRIAEVGVKLALVIARYSVPDDLGALLSKHSPELLDELRVLYEAYRGG